MSYLERKTSERNFTKSIKSVIEARGGFVVKHFANSFTKSGIPDLLVCLCGQYMAIEVKVKPNKASELQKEQIKRIRGAGGFAIVLYPENFKKFKEILDEWCLGNMNVAYDRMLEFDREAGI